MDLEAREVLNRFETDNTSIKKSQAGIRACATVGNGTAPNGPLLSRFVACSDRVPLTTVQQLLFQIKFLKRSSKAFVHAHLLLAKDLDMIHGR